jgi:DNA-binding transcriptional regulator PaaX
MVSASLNSADPAGAELAAAAELDDDVPEPPWFMPGMLVVSVLPAPEPVEHPARAMAAATAAAEMVKVFFMKIGVLQSISGTERLWDCMP